MMNETVQNARTQVVMPDFEELEKLEEDYDKGQAREQGITETGEIHSRQDNRDPELRKRIVQGPFGRRWSRNMNPSETYRAPSLFTWRC